MNILSKPTRPRLHFSTYFVALLLLGIAVLLIVPAESVDPSNDPFSFTGASPAGMLDHGWPFVYLRRNPFGVPRPAPPARSPRVQRMYSAWQLGTGVTLFRPWALGADLVIALIIISALAWLYELRRRKRTRAIQFSIGGMLIVVTAAGLVCGWLTHAALEHRREQRILKPGYRNGEGINGTITVRPYWLWCAVERLTGENYGARVRSVQVPATLLEKAKEFRAINNLAVLGMPTPDEAKTIGQLPELREFVWSRTNPRQSDSQAASATPVQIQGVAEMFRQLKKHKRLRKLTIGGRCGDELFDLLADLSELEELWIHGEVADAPWATLSIENARALSKLRNLKLLKLRGFSLNDESAKFLDDLTELRYLYLYNSDVGNETLKRIAALKKLEGLTIIGGHFDAAGVRALTTLPDISDLALTEVPLDDQVWPVLQQLHKLQNLDLRGTKVTSIGNPRPGDFPDLGQLNLSRTLVSGNGLEGIANLKTADLQVDLSGTKISAATLKALAGMDNFNVLDLRGTNLDDSALQEIAQIKGQFYVNLYQTKITEKAANNLNGPMPDFDPPP